MFEEKQDEKGTIRHGGEDLPRMAPGQQPYSEEEWEAVKEMVADAAAAEEAFTQEELEAGLRSREAPGGASGEPEAWEASALESVSSASSSIRDDYKTVEESSVGEGREEAPDASPAAAVGRRQSVYEEITEKVVASLEKGERPWKRPWDAQHAAGPITRPLRHDGTPYKGINVIALWTSALEKNYSAPIWLTFKQARELGGHVRKGEKGSRVVYAGSFTKDVDDGNGGTTPKELRCLKGYTVFNVEQIGDLPGHFYAKRKGELLDPRERIARADEFFRNTGAKIRESGDRAFYSKTSDMVVVPRFEHFKDKESHAATMAHELTHWTRHPSRLDRDFGQKEFGDEGYAKEELVAELASAFLCADLEISDSLREDHEVYVASWLEALKNDKRLIFEAAKHAQRAVDYLHQRQEGGYPRTRDPDSGELLTRDGVRVMQEGFSGNEGKE